MKVLRGAVKPVKGDNNWEDDDWKRGCSIFFKECLLYRLRNI